MTTKPSDMKPSDAILGSEYDSPEAFARGWGSLGPIFLRLLAYLDERHAAGQGEPKSKGPRYCDEHGGYGFRSDCLHCALMDRAPIAAPPAQPVREPIAEKWCSICRDTYLIFDLPGEPCPKHPPVTPAQPVARREECFHGIGLCTSSCPSKKAPAQPVAAEPAVPVAGEPTCGGCGRAECTMLRRGDAGPALEDCRRYQYEHQRELRSEALDAALAQVEQLKGKLELCHEAHATMLANWSNEQRAHGETKRTLTAAQLSISEKKTI